jgi:putative Na+/H+ antiporter
MSSNLLGALALHPVQVAATAIFAVAVLHTFSTRFFEHLAHLQPNHAGLWHLLGEVEVVFGVWAIVLIAFLVLHEGSHGAFSYLEGQSFREPAFIFVIMVMAASRPVLDFSAAVLLWLARLLPLRPPMAYYMTVLSIGPLLGSFITEPAAMTLSAMLLLDRYFSAQAPNAFKYGTLGVLFVNVSIGGTLTPYAAPPVLMVADRWGWDIGFMLQTFGWKSALAVCVNAICVATIFRNYLKQMPHVPEELQKVETPWAVIAVHLMLLAAVVVASHHILVFIGLFLFFLGLAEAYRRYQTRLILREGLLVGFFLAGLVVLGGQQEWWLQPVLSGMGTTTLYYGATLLTAITDNAALTYLGSLVSGISAEAKYALVAGSVTGGGLTVIANAPNPAGFAILKGTFNDGAISPLWLALAAAPPTLVAIAAFQLLPG